ncbi:DUF2809 domain-containing protein [soil metagenome]
MSSARVNFVAAAVLTMATGLFVYTNGALLGPIAHDMLGDGLWAAMIAWLAGALAPDTRVAVRGAAAYAFCVGIELSQLYHAPTLDALRATRLGHLVLGSGFDARDFVSYAMGVGVAVLVELFARGRVRRRIKRA